ncbi:MAG: hypothetical protein OEQ28_14980 [Acidobacteriota bacterium]|nr:hypothetical protein [Acidobacteriota bacterium]
MTYPLPAEPGFYLEAGFIALSIAMIAGFAFVSRSKLVFLTGALWASISGLIGYSGVVQDFSTLPPRILFLFLPMLAGVVFVAFSRFGKRLTNFSLTFLVGFQSFRILVELLIHEAVKQGVAPPQLTWTGMNFDIITGITALLLIPFAKRLPHAAIHIWNVIGIGLLALVVCVAIVSMPTPMQLLKPDNVWVAYFPFIWLPTIMVTFAFLGHLVLYRKLRFSAAASLEEGSDD